MTNQSQPNSSQLVKFNDEQSLKVASAYVPKGQPSKVAYIKLVQDKCMQIGEGKYGSSEDLLAFMYTCYRTGLDPVANQIHTQFRWDGKLGRNRMIIITGIDGFRLIAQRSKLYGGQDDAKFEVEELYNPVSDTMEKQLKASVTVFRLNPKTGDRMAITASARWNAYVQKYMIKDKQTGQSHEEIGGVWKTNPHGMLAKCAEALALRKAFPQDLSGIYTEDEMGAPEDTRKQIISDLPTPKPIADRKSQNAPQATDAVEGQEVSQTEKNNEEGQVSEAKQEVITTPDQANKKLNEILDRKKNLEGNK